MCVSKQSRYEYLNLIYVKELNKLCGNENTSFFSSFFWLLEGGKMPIFFMLWIVR